MAKEKIVNGSSSEELKAMSKAKIFIGSSSEALKLEAAEQIKGVIDEAGMEGFIWDRGAFEVGLTLLETIESLPFEIHGAVILATPDISYSRGNETFWAPVSNVVFEYGYLAARLTRRRVAICKFGTAELASDLHGLKVVEIKAEDYDYKKGDTSALPEKARDELRDWLTKMPQLAERLSPVSQVHGYSGTWNVESTFSLWRGTVINAPHKVYFNGKTFLVLPNDGKRGSGVQIGKLYIAIDKYRATYEIVNEILDASVDEQGTLRMRVKVVRRVGPKGVRGKLHDPKFAEALANKEFVLELKPRSGKPRTLEGSHEYLEANKKYQSAKELWEYSGLFGCSCL